MSNFGPDLLERCARIRPLDACQLPLSLLEDGIVEAQLPWLAERGVATIVYSPLESGLLSGTFSLERLAALPEDDWRRRRPRFQSPEVERALDLVERLRPVAAGLGVSVAELAIAWAAHFEGWPARSSAPAPPPRSTAGSAPPTSTSAPMPSIRIAELRAEGEIR